ncbi:MAG: flavodoxin [Spirochaetes bacterium GWD1_61_31]|nr:MAG: flavodoxin [Spirochaetes bacterium GWB1_60_80]OHD33500.1 MAG: flavodoxin [Spirochaetes bacterium GWC1_61_12]OHD36916.1 MAG: flavodoxin [Spirochaetes bacterium GWD1_61_31]OHD42638.1 MAG: flavodoxin [Spirochaetes bacterium GWE1_60_18]OHD58020.1 MAG: flavodoxin [Spirochaetes bacterium GWF1_60_12]HAP42618.1 flavodoxin [Spirochaetaceae bacterium]
MSMVHIVFWSGTGNTQRMAEAIAAGAAKAGAPVVVSPAAEARVETVLAAPVLALGCPSMGAEVLEESEMEPFVMALEAAGLRGKKLALFGSYDWGDGQWMREWQERMEKSGAIMVTDGLIANNTPDADALGLCAALGAKLAGA